MHRRHFIPTLAAAAAAVPTQGQNSTPLLHPKALRPGDTVALITPSTHVTDPDRLQTVARTVEYFGLKAKFGRNVKKKWGYAGGTIDERIDDLHAAFADPAVSAVFCIRGGYAAGQLLDRIDYKLIERNPKIFIGYSDITAMHLAIHKLSGLVTFHGPVTTSAFTPYTRIATNGRSSETVRWARSPTRRRRTLSAPATISGRFGAAPREANSLEATCR